MRRVPILLLVFLALAPLSRAEDEPRRLTVLASPALPEALLERIPGKQVDGRIRWPLPEGDLLVLGLPCQDTDAHQFGTAFAIREVGECLFGGYAIARWWEGDRWISTVLAHDFVSLRLGLEALDARAGPLHTTNVRPRFQIRAIAASEREAPDAALVRLALQGRANRVLFRPGTALRWPEATRRVVRELKAHGIRLGWHTARPRLFASLPEIHPVMEVWADGAEPQAIGPARGAIWTPETTSSVSVEDARAARRRFGKRILLDLRSPRRGPRIPAGLPHPPGFSPEVDRVPPSPLGRDPRLGAVVEGVLVSTEDGARAHLAAAWRTTPELEAPWRYYLLPFLPRRWTSPGDLLKTSAACLREVPHAPPWMQQLSRHLDRQGRDLDSEPSDAVLEVPYVPRAPELDGRLDDPAWAFAAPLGLGDDGRLFLVADGRGLHLGLRSASPGLRYELTIEDPVGGRSRFSVARSGPLEHESPGGWTRVRRRSANPWTVEMHLDSAALGGDAYPTRLLDLAVRAENSGATLWRGRILMVP